MQIIHRFERQVFHYGIILGVIFRIIRSVHEILIDSPIAIVLLGCFNLLLWVTIFYIYKKHFEIAFFIFFFQILITSILTWNNAGGWNGSMPYMFFLLVTGLVITSHGLRQIIMLSAVVFVIVLFSFTSILDSFSAHNASYSLLSREFDFLINTGVLILVTFYLKESFFSYREAVELTNQRLQQSTEKLMEQTNELYQQQAELNMLRGDLEKIISGKISESQSQVEALKEYSFVNSHHVRAPLARVLGLIELIEVENRRTNTPSDTIQKVKRDAVELDVILNKINTVVG